jgi:hypothetical protein
MAEAVLIAGKTHLKDRLDRSPVSLNEKTKEKDPWLAAHAIAQMVLLFLQIPPQVIRPEAMR